MSFYPLELQLHFLLRDVRIYDLIALLIVHCLPVYCFVVVVALVIC